MAAGALIGVGSKGSLTVNAAESINRLEMATAGSTVGAGGATAFAGSGVGFYQDSTTLAELESGTPGGATVTGGGPINIMATTGGTQISLAGALDRVGASTHAFGMSVVVNDIQRTTMAGLGADASTASVTPAGLANINTAGALTISATVTGQIAGLAAAGIYPAAAAEPAAVPVSTDASGNPDNALPQTNGASVAPASDTKTSGAGIADPSAQAVVSTTKSVSDAFTRRRMRAHRPRPRPRPAVWASPAAHSSTSSTTRLTPTSTHSERLRRARSR